MAGEKATRADQRHLGEIVQGEQAGLEPVVHIVVVVGDVVGQGRGLGFRRSEARQPQIMAGAVLRDGAEGRIVQPVLDRPIVLDHPLQRLPAQIQAVEVGVAALQPGQQPKGLDVVVEPAIGRHAGLELVLARVGERRMAEVVGQGDAFGQIVVQSQRLGQRAGDLGHLQAVGQAGAEVIALVRHKHLGLLLQPAEG